LAARRTLKTGETVGGFVLPGIRFAVIGCAMRNKGLRHRITVITGDAVGGELPAGYDVFLLANLIHHYSSAEHA
jgi:hypothetical protein